MTVTSNGRPKTVTSYSFQENPEIWMCTCPGLARKSSGIVRIIPVNNVIHSDGQIGPQCLLCVCTLCFLCLLSHSAGLHPPHLGSRFRFGPRSEVGGSTSGPGTLLGMCGRWEESTHICSNTEWCRLLDPYLSTVPCHPSNGLSWSSESIYL